MSKITYQTLLSQEVTEFCDLMGGLFGKIERDLYKDLYKDLEKGKKLNNLKKSYQIKYGINARQFNSIHLILKGKIASRKECYKSQLKQAELKIKGLQKTIDSEKKKLAKLPSSCGRSQKSVSRKLRFTIHQKQRKLATLKDRLATFKNKKPSIVFGGKKLWYAQYNLKENVKFSYGQSSVEYALNNGQALTFRFVRKEEKWYLFCSFDLPETPTISHNKNGMLGIDLNPNIIGCSYCNCEGNLKAKGQIKINVRDKNTNQTKAIMGDAVKKLVKLAYQYECPISVENLDFERKKATMKEEGVKYSRMLSNFAYSCFLEMLNSCAFKHGIDIIKVNPAFSSIIGLMKFMRLYGLSSDTAAALVLARRALRKKEGIPTSYARLIQVDSSRHVWSFWNALNKKLKGIKRHSFFNSVSHREVEVKLLDELHSNRFNSKSQDTSITRRDSLSRVVNNSARLTQNGRFGF